MAEGIMGLAPGMGAPAAPQQAPQELDPRNLQVFMDTYSSMDPAEFEGQVDEAVGEIDPALAQQIQAELSTIQVTLEEKEALLEMVNFVLSNPESYDQVRIQGIEMGLPEELFPEEFDLEFFSTLRYVIVRLPVQQAEPPVQGFKNGGPVSLKPIAKFLASQGRGGDTILAHINSKEAAMLKRMGGAGTLNPTTGLREYKSASDTLKKAGKKIVGVAKKIVSPVLKLTKKLLSSPIVRVVATGAAVYFSGGTASALLGAGAAKTAAGVALGATINSTAVNLLAGEKPKDALKQGLMIGATSGAGAYFGGMPLTQSTSDVALTNPFTGSQSTVRGLGKGALDAVNPFSSSGASSITADTKYLEMVKPTSEGGLGLPTNADTYRLATEAAKSANASTILGMTTPQAITTAATLVPPVLSYLGQPDPPKPEDLNMPGVGGPTGYDLLNQDPSTYGVNIGDTSSTYTDPYAGLANTSAMQIGNSSGAPASVPGAPAPLPGASSTPFATTSTPMPGSEAYEQMFSRYDPTKDPMNPAYNPFSASTQVAAAPSNLTGGFNTSQGFAQGGIVTLARGGRVKKASARLQAQKAGEERNRAKASFELGRTSGKPKSPAELQREARASAMARQRVEQRTSAERQKRVDSALASAQKAAQEGRSLNFGPGYANEQGLYLQAIESAKKSNPTNFMTPNEAEAYVAQQRIANIAKEKASFEQSQAQAIALAKRNEEALAAKQKAEKELADFEAYKASIVGPGASTQPITPGGSGTLPVTPPANITLGGAGNPTADMSNTGPSVPGVPEISIGAGAPAMSPAVMVYGPDGTSYGSPSAAITAGVFNYSMTPPAAGGIGSFAAPNISAPSVNFGSAPAISPTNVPSAFGTGSTVGFGSGSTAGAFGSGNMTNAFGMQPQPQAQSFAGGGIAAMAPYRFSRGTNPTQQYPRRTGPINGPGTGTSDSIPAMLSDGEFVFTAKAVRNMGGGSRLDGAKKMYKMMKMLERKS